MNNVFQTNGVPLTVFGGAVPELAPEDLPEGASPFNQDCDFNPGSVFTRGGRQNQITYANLFVLASPNLGQSLSGAFAPNEVVWSIPNNVTTNSPTSPAVVVLNGIPQPPPNVLGVDAHVPPGPTTASWTVQIPPGYVRNLLSWWLSGSLNGSITVTSPGYTNGLIIGGGVDYGGTFPANSGSVNFAFTTAGASVPFTGVLSLWNTDGFTISGSVRIQTFGGNGGFGSSFTTANISACSTGTMLMFQVAWLGATTAIDPNHSTVTDTNGNTWAFIGMSQGAAGANFNGTAMYACMTPVPNRGTFTITVNFKNSSGGAVSTGSFVGNGGELAHIGVNGIFAAIDQTAFTNSGASSVTSFTIGPIFPSFPNSTAFMYVGYGANGATTPPAGWGNWNQSGAMGTATQNNTNGALWMLSATGSVSGTFTTPNGVSAAILFDLPNAGPMNPYPWQVHGVSAGNWQTLPTNTFVSNTTAGNMIAVFGVCTSVFSGTAISVTSVTDTQGNTYQVLQSGGTVNGAFVFVAIAQNIVGGADTVTVHFTGTGATSYFDIFEFATGPNPGITTNVSQVLAGTLYGANVPSNVSVLGAEILVSGKQNSTNPASTVTVSLNQPGSSSVTLALPQSNTTTVLGSPTSTWGLALNPTLVNTPGFGINLVAQSPSSDTVSIYGLQLKLFLSPNPPGNFNWIKTYEQTDGEVDTLLLDTAGRLWDEDVDSNPTVLNSIFITILPNTFAKSVTFADIEYIAFSNLVNGTDVPRQWNSTNLDRISMVGPGAAPSAVVTGGAGGSNSTAIANIQQPAQVEIRRIVWGASANAINDATPGNILLIMGEGRTANIYQTLNPYTNLFGAGTTVQLSGITNPFPLKGGGSLPFNLNNGPNANHTYTVQAVTTGIVGGNETVPLFEVQAPATEYGYSQDFGSGGPPPTSNWFYQSCVATITMQNPLPNVGVGSTIQISGTGTAYDGTWTVLQAPNAVNMTITSVILSGGIATYSYSLVGASLPPTVGELVSTLNVLNGSGIGAPGIFNVTNVAIQSVSGGSPTGTFSIPLSNPAGDIPTQTQGGTPPATANVGGTIFTFDAGQIVNSGNPVTGGNIVQQGQVATGVRKVCYSFLTRSGFITQPSPIYTMNVTSGAGSITVSGLSPGPPNVIARIVFFTGANGGNFFYIPQEVDVPIPGQPVQINTATIVNDNTSTSAQFSFTDAVLLSATAIDITGNNLFNCIELGSCRGLLTYSSRMIAWSEQQKTPNLRNVSFDGGYNPANNEPLGWTADQNSGGGSGLNFTSPVFGWTFQISNTTGVTQASYGMITQPAYQDEFLVPIINANTLYSVRITAQVTPAQASGNLIVDLFSASTGGGTVLGSFSIPLASMTTSMQIYTGTLLTTILHPVPKDLLIRIWAQNILNGATILIDRMEPFQTLVPVNTTAFKCSYVNNQESFDLVTGVCGPAQNNQPINGGAVLFDLLYALKEKSWYSTFDNGTTEPNEWNWKTVSEKVGTIGIHSYDWGEGWMLTANRQGVFFFEGGEPIKVSQEIQPVWDAINWQYGYTIWLRNDPEQRRFTVGIPIPTPNIYMPEFPANPNPTSPNVILMCNYRELNSGSALAQTGPIRSTFTGRLMSPEPARKWSFWNIACPYSDYISRANSQWPQFYCTGYQDSKIFQLLASQLSDDGGAINSFWISYGFVKPEMADAKGLGLFRMEFPYFTVLATGTGTLNTYVYPESPFNSPYVLDPLPLPAISQGDLEIGVNVKGQRFFVRVGTNAVGSGFRCSKMVVPLVPDPWSPIRGYNVLTA